MDSTPSKVLLVKAVTASSYSANFRPEYVLRDNPEDILSRRSWWHCFNISPTLTSECRWTTENHHRPEWLKLELDDLSIIKTITFGKHMSEHPCNVQHFQVYGSVEDVSEMTLLLESSLKNDNVAQTFPLKHSTEDDVVFPCKFIKIVPVRAFNPTFNMSFWHIVLRGSDDSRVVSKAFKDFSTFREKTALQLILKYLRPRAPRSYQTLLSETGFEIEHPLIAEFERKFVRDAKFDRAEELLEKFAQDGLFNLRLSNPRTRPATTWRKLFDPPLFPLPFTPPISADPSRRASPAPIHLPTSRYYLPSSYPSRRGGHMSAYDPEKGHMYVFGGWDGLKDSAELWMWDIATERWTCLSQDTSAVPVTSTAGAPPVDPTAPASMPGASSSSTALPGISDEADMDDGWSDLDPDEQFFDAREIPDWAAAGRDNYIQNRRMRRIALSGATGPDARSCGSAVFDEAAGDIYILGRYIPRGSAITSDTFSASNAPGTGAEGTSDSRPPGRVDDAGATASQNDRQAARLQRLRRAVFGGDDTEGSSRPADDAQPSRAGMVQSLNTRFPRSDFWRYHTRGPLSGRWEMLSADTKADGGPDLVHDLAMCYDPEDRVIYVFGGEVYNQSGRTAKLKYGGFYSYNIETCTWRKIFEDPYNGRSIHGLIPGRSCNSMVFDQKSNQVYIIGGERAGKLLDEVWTYHTPSGNVSMMAFPTGSRVPNPDEIMRATLDPETREIFLLPELITTSTSRAHSHAGQNGAFGSGRDLLTTLWIYSLDENTWTAIVEPFRSSLENSQLDANDFAESLTSTTSSLIARPTDSKLDESVPRPRIGYSLVYDTHRKEFIAFGGNANGTRMNDVWSLRFSRPSAQDFIRRGRLQIRGEKFKYMCETEPSLLCLQYLQTTLSEVVDHNDQEESAMFRKLLSYLLTRPDSPVASTRPPPPSTRAPHAKTHSIVSPSPRAPSHPTDIVSPRIAVLRDDFNIIGDESFEVEQTLRSRDDDDGGEDMDVASPISPQNGSHPKSGAGDPTASFLVRKDLTESEKTLMVGREGAFKHILGFIDPRAKQPSVDLIDMIRTEY